MALERAGLEQVDEEYWKLHIEEDIKPYGCLYPRCSRSLVLFAHRQEWESHMKSKHPSHWMQTVHTLTWFCDVDHNDTLAFETELQRREHVLDPALHPNREELPNEPQLAATTVRHKDHEASYGGYDGITKLLVNHGANIHIADQRYGRTALAWADFNDYETLVGTLTEAGGNPDAFDNFGRTLLGQAVEGGDEGTARILMAANADCELRDLKSGRTPLA
ncbi:ankyrin repeat-containing domain protein [Fusarium tricinctum]|uniref:Ankyrin repeat-containing domain protein n=1 Tax=Fusarium tricinctum TaxID=61284 RepID=A0A8K0RQI5_9HYPO|nr:ankyrin repeat-containing domain protein [Fusarium tricinctum]